MYLCFFNCVTRDICKQINVDSVECHASGQDRPLLVLLSVATK